VLDNFIQPDSDMESAIVLAIYRNRINHLFFRDSFVAVAIWSALHRDDNLDDGIIMNLKFNFIITDFDTYKSYCHFVSRRR
jgi:glycerol-3-phosphate O-acyltransferase